MNSFQKVLLSLCLIGSAISPVQAQDQPVPGRSNTNIGTNGGNVTGNLGDSGPRFQVRLTSFQVFDETGLDFLGSDEAVFVVKGESYKVGTAEYGSLDSNGSVHPFRGFESCAFPPVDSGEADGRWTCDPTGSSAPVDFTLQAWEQDEDVFGFCARNLAFSDVLPPGGGICGADPAKNQLIGEYRVQIDLPTLIQKLPRVGDSFDGNAILEGACNRYGGVQPCTIDDIEPRYNVTYTVTRVPDVASNNGGVLVQ